MSVAGGRGERIDSIGIDTWGVDFACVDPDGDLLGLPRAYRDPYTDGVPEEFFRTVPRESVYAKTGIQVMNFNSLYQLYALNREHSPALAAAEHVLFMPDALSYLLTGEQVCEYTILSTSQLMNPRTRELDGELLRAAGVDASLFARRVMPGERVGVLRDEVARRTGLGRVEVFAVAGHDTASAIAAVPCRRRALRLSLVGHVVAHGYRVARSGHHGGVVRDELHQRGRRGRYDAVPEKTSPACGCWRSAAASGRRRGVPIPMPRSWPWLPPPSRAGRASIPTTRPSRIRPTCRRRSATGAAAGARSRRRTMRRSCAASSRAWPPATARCWTTCAAWRPSPSKRLHVIGGGAQNDLLNQLTADACGIPVVAGPSEATAIGNVMVQARALGLVGSLARMRDYIRRSVEVREFLPRTK